MSVEQYEVRNALTKKHLTIEEQRQLTRQYESASELEIIIILFRLFTAIPVKEMLAIRYGEINKIKDYGFYQVDIVKVIDKDGQHRVFGEKNDWNRYRKIPLINELGLFIEKRKQAWMKRYNLSEKQINKIPVFIFVFIRIIIVYIVIYIITIIISVIIISHTIIIIFSF